MGKTEKTESGKSLSRLIRKAYVDLHTRAAEGAFVVWVAINVPVELFSGFENVVYAVPESHAALNAGKGIGAQQCEKAENLGYSMDLCSYARIDIGSDSDMGKDSPTMGLPRPDLLVSDNNNCSLLVKWFDVHHREKGVPHLVLDVPFCYEPQKEKDLNYIVTQFQNLINTIENLSGQKYDPEKTKAALKHTAGGISHWKRFLSFAGHSPSGITAFDSFVQMAPFLVVRGTPEFEDHYMALAKETEERVRQGIFPVPDEKYRLFWDNIAPWHQLRKMSSRLKEFGANIIGASYTSCIGAVEGTYQMQPYDDDPLRYLARTQNCYICPYGLDLRQKAMSSAIRELEIDGVVFASNRSCKPYSICQMDQQRYIRNTLGIPAVMIDVDHADVRKYDEEKAFLNIQALLEQIDNQRSAA